MKKHIIDLIIPMLIGVIAGSVITGFTVVNSFQNKMEKYELLIQRVVEDNPTYVDDILCETDEWYEVCGD